MTFIAYEAAVGLLLHDIGKLMQGVVEVGQKDGPQEPHTEKGSCSITGKGASKFRHEPWTDAFFKWMEDESLCFPHGIRLSAVRTFAGCRSFLDGSKEEAAMERISALSYRYSSSP